MWSIPPNKALGSVPWTSLSYDSIPVQVRPEDVVALLVDDGPWSVYWRHSGDGKAVSSGDERIVGFLGRRREKRKVLTISHQTIFAYMA